LEPEDKEGLEGIVEGEVIENWPQGEGFQEVEEAENNPVGEPLDIILITWRFNGLERKISWETPAYEVRDRRRESINKDQKGHKNNAANDEEGLGDLGALFNIVEYRVFCELFVNLVSNELAQR
jgi:hypothetical protein